MMFRILFLALLIPWLPQTGATLTPAEYQQVVEQALAEITQSTAEELPATLNRWVEQFAAIHGVQVAAGTEAPVDSSDLIAVLRASPPDRERVIQRLKALDEALKSWGQRPPSADTFDRLRAILARPEFQHGPQPAQPSRWETFLENLAARLAPVLTAISQLLPYLAALVLLGVLYLVLRGSFANLVAEARTHSRLGQDEEPETPGEARRRAEERAAAGDYRTAVRYLYLATLLLLDEQGWLRYDRARTNREVLGDMAGEPELVRRLAPVVETFDQVWYGIREPDEATYCQYVENVRQVQEGPAPTK